MNDLDLFLKSAQELLQDPSLQLFCRPEWGSKNQDHRQLLHTQIAKIKESASDFHTSLAHAADLGFIGASRFAIGVDAERSDRVLPKIVERVSSFNELPLAPSASALWCAKEACFKALRTFKQPPVISQLSIGDWQPRGSEVFTCRLLNSESFKAPALNLCVVLQTYEHTFAVSLIKTP